MSEVDTLRLFEAHGIEIEYMIVDADTLSVRPIADELLKQVGGGYEMEVERGDLAWSNELALHVIELKTNGPTESLAGLGARFHDHVGQIEDILKPLGARLLPTAMHPWMDPETEIHLWPHGDKIIYETFDRIFGCKNHGWANLQSIHINLPFSGDAEFGKLHAAMRMVLPLLPGLAASSPLIEGSSKGYLDQRLEEYRNNARCVPSVTGHVVPERVFTRRDYEKVLLGNIYKDLAPHDPDGVLSYEWVNSRGCIARFDRMAIEIRLLDVQECPKADMAIVGAVVAVVRALVEETWSTTAEQQAWAEEPLESHLLAAIVAGDAAVLSDKRYLESFGYPERGCVRLGDLWQHLVETQVASHDLYPEWMSTLDLIREQGCLARRITKAVGADPDRAGLRAVYRELADCLSRGDLFRAS